MILINYDDPGLCTKIAKGRNGAAVVDVPVMNAGYTLTRHLSILILLSGDVEMNPGPGYMVSPRYRLESQNSVEYDQTTGTPVKRKPKFNKFGQHEPPTVRIKNIINQYVGDTKGIGLFEVVKELTQNADDANATKIEFILDKRTLNTEKVWDEWRLLQGPSFCVYNNAIFTDQDIECIQKLGVGSKGHDPDKTGQFGIGFNVVYQMTDCPSLISNGIDLCMFDPHLTYVPGATNGCPGGHVNLRHEPEFKEMWDDVLQGYLGEYLRLQGGTVFRFPLRTPAMNSKISDVVYGEDEMKQMQRDLEDYDFRMFLHSCLIFTKHIEEIEISIINTDGKKETITVVRRNMSPRDQNEIKMNYQRLSNEIKSLLIGRISINDITSTSISYNMVIEDEFNKTEWMLNQTFGFHGDFEEEELEFLQDFLCEDNSGKKFSPIAGIAAKRDPETLKGASFCFLQLPIETGLPVHLNGHFAIHSSRRSLWSNTAFGNWNRILEHHVLVPAYCTFLRHASKMCELDDVSSWYLKLFPNADGTTDQYYGDLVRDVYYSLVHTNLPIIPLVRPESACEEASESVEFFGSRDLYFVSMANRNPDVERLLLVIGINICKYPELSAKFIEAKISTIDFLKPRVASSCLKDATARLKLPLHVSTTPFLSTENVKVLLQYCLQDETYKDYLRLDGLPLCVTAMETLREFKRRAPVFLCPDFQDLLPDNQDLFINESFATLFDVSQASQNSPIRKLNVQDIPAFLNLNSECTRDIEWVKRIWVFLKMNITRYNGRSVMYQVKDLPLLTASDGKRYKVSDGKNVVNIYSASKEMQSIIRKLDMPLFDAELLLSDEFSQEDASELASYCVLDAGQPEDILHLLTVYQGNSYELTEDECETLLHYFKCGIEVIRKSQLFQKTLTLIPIFETIEGDYQSLSSSCRVSILDDSIPTKGISKWMKDSDCLLLKEKKPYEDLYALLGLGKKNTVDIYTDYIFPNFPGFDEDLRISHLCCIRDKIMPMLNSFATESSKRIFSQEMMKLSFIPDDNGKLLHACDFFSNELLLLGQLDGIRALPEQFQGPEWKELLRIAGMKSEVTATELINCAEAIVNIDDNPEEATRQAKIILDTALQGDFDVAVLQQLAVIPFIPLEPLDLDEELIQACIPKYAKEHMPLRGALQNECKQDRILLKNSHLTWSVASTLPKWVTIPNELINDLGISPEPTVSEVCAHVINMCIAVTDQLGDGALKSFEQVMLQVYDFLMGKCNCNSRDCDQCKEVLDMCEAKCIVLNDGTIRVKGNQLVLNFPSDIDSDTLHPYIYARPVEMAKFDELFRRLGAYEVPKPDTFAEILNRLREDCGGSHLKTNQKQTASTAFYGLIVTLENDFENKLNVRPLYLPSEKAVMHHSSELIVKDNKILARKFKKKNYEYLCKLSSCNLNKTPREYVMLLPCEVRPRMLTDMVQQTVKVTSVCRVGKRCMFMSEYKKRMTGDDFARAILLLSQASETKIEEVKQRISELKVMDFVCFREIKCYLSEKGIPTDVINTPKLVHFERDEKGHPSLFMKHCDWYPGEADILSAIADALKLMICADLPLSLDSGKISKLLRCQDTRDAIDDFLVEEGVASIEEDMMSRPRLGTVIPAEEELMYSCDPDIRFQPKEYVAYMNPETEPPIMIHARIVRECKSKKREQNAKEMSNMFREYVIDIGLDHPLTAQSLDLYREVKRQQTQQESDTREIITDNVTDAEERYSRMRDQMATDEAKRQCSRLLLEVFSDPMRVDERDKLRKRLFLKWHPDKAGGSMIAKGVFQHIQAEVERLTAQYPNYRSYGKSKFAFKQDVRAHPPPTHQQYQQRQNQQPQTQPAQPDEPQSQQPRYQPQPHQKQAEQEHTTSEQSNATEYVNTDKTSEANMGTASPRSDSEYSRSPTFSTSSSDSDGNDHVERNGGGVDDQWYDTKDQMSPDPAKFQGDSDGDEPILQNGHADVDEILENGGMNGFGEKMNGHTSKSSPFNATLEWFKQAKRDMKCALLLKGQGNNEWVCSICYEVVRKLLMGTLSSFGRSLKEFQMSRFLPKLVEKICELPDHPPPLSGDIDILRRLNANYLFNFDSNTLSERTVQETYTDSVTNQALETTQKMSGYMSDYCDLDWENLLR